MKTYKVRLAWNHKGTRYQKCDALRVQATSIATAAARALKIIKRREGRNYREPIGAEVSIHVLVVGDERKEQGDVRVHEESEPEEESRGDGA